MIRPLTEQLYDALCIDAWPSYAVCVDFGIDSSSHLGALQYVVKKGIVSKQRLDNALGNGPALTRLVKVPGNAYGHVVFKTVWDTLEE